MSEIVKSETENTVKLYGSDAEIQALGTLVKQFAPWAEKLDNIQIGGVVRRVMAMGLDPLNGYEVQIWKDKRGIVQVQPAYTLMIDWVKKFKGDHTQPRYTRLIGDELASQGLPENAIAYRCTFIMNEDLDRMTTLLNMGVYNPEEVRAMFEVSGLGVAQLNEYDGEYFAPAGRSKSWKVEKRSLMDAYRHKFGTPSRAEIETLRRESGTDKIQPDDWDTAYRVCADQRGTVALAQDTANRRESPAMTQEEAAVGISALYPDHTRGKSKLFKDDGLVADAVEGVFKDVEEILGDDGEGFARMGLCSAPQNEPQTDGFDEAAFNFEEIEPIPFDYETKQEPEPPQLHWIDVPGTRNAFWGWTHDQGLKKTDVYEALGTTKMHSYTGTVDEAKATISEWLDAKTGA